MKRKLIEVALPLEAINRESAREKTIRHGHPSTLHLWWARRPLAACRALLFASLVDDPASHPERYLTEAAQAEERARLFALIEELVGWDSALDPRVLSRARDLIRESVGEPADVVVCDPFSGGGSIPLEAMRLGLTAHAADLNPVPTVIAKALLELPTDVRGQGPYLAAAPQLAPSGVGGLIADLDYLADWFRSEAQQRIGHIYPKAVTQTGPRQLEAPVIAWIWARTAPCCNPACAASIPLTRTFSLSTKSHEAWLIPQVRADRSGVDFTVQTTGSGPSDPPKTGRGGNFRCLVCHTVSDESYVKAVAVQRGLGQQLLAVVAEVDGRRTYLDPSCDRSPTVDPPTDLDWLTQPMSTNPRWFSPPAFGMTTFRDLFTDRQLVALTTAIQLVDEACALAARQGASKTYVLALRTYLAFGVSKATSRNCTLALWETGMGRLAGALGRQALPMTWDFAETNPLSGSGGDIGGTIHSVVEVLQRLPEGPRGQALQRDARTFDEAGSMVFTDPPYYDNIGYADLSDFYYVWLRRMLATQYPDLFSTLLTPKTPELIATPHRFGGNRAKARAFFEQGLRESFQRIRASQRPDIPFVVFYAFKQTESDASNGARASTGWETMLEGLLGAGFAVTATWPIRSELVGALKKDVGALATSVALVCRPRATDAPLASRKEFLGALRSELPSALGALQEGNIAPVDLAQASIGPGMAIFSRYARVVDADGSPMTVRDALAAINATLDEVLAQQDADYDAETRWALAWYEQFGFDEGPYGSAEALSRAKNTAINALQDAGLLVASGGKVRLLGIEDLPVDWNPVSDAHLTVWEIVQHLVRLLDTGGEPEAALVLAASGGLADVARELAYRLFGISEKAGRAGDALRFNGLVAAWPELARLGRQQPTPQQQSLDV